MPTDPRVDAYIAAQQPFARPILAHLRAVVHDTAPLVEETIKWGRPFFTLGGRPFCFVAAFSAHAAFGFWQDLAPTGRETEASGSFGKLRSLADLPRDGVLREMILDAVARARKPSPARKRATPRPPLPVPADLEAALAAAPEAGERFAVLSPSHRREYLEWIEEAKRPETRTRRIATTIERLMAGGALNAKYARR